MIKLINPRPRVGKKTNIIIGLSVIIVIIITLFSLTRHREQSVATPRNKPTILIPFPMVTTSISTPNQFIWQIDHLKLPPEVTIFSTEPNTQGKTILKNLAINLGFKGEPETIPNTPILLYSNPLESADLYLNTEENIIKYGLNLLEKSTPKTNIKPFDQINQDLITLLQESLGLQSPLSISKASTHYQTTNGPRFINTTPEKATLVNSTYNYSINSLPILYPNGNSINTIHSLSGKLVNLSLNLPPHPAPADKGTLTLPVKTITQIKSTPQFQFTTIMLSGNEEFTLSFQEIDLEEATITNGFLGYIYSQNTLIPYIFLTGTTQDPNYDTIELLLATPATL